MKGILHSPLLSSLSGLNHGFTTLELAQGEQELLSRRVATLHQVHGHELLWADKWERKERKGDALATRSKGLAVGVYSADCVPALVAAYQKGKPLATMAVHAGWRGTAQNILLKALTGFVMELGPCEIFVALGPAIGFEAFEVGVEVIDAFPHAPSAGLSKIHPKNPGKFLLDLIGENARQAKSAAQDLGFPLHLDIRSPCTHSNPILFPSFRRDGSHSGRILSFIELSTAP